MNTSNGAHAPVSAVKLALMAKHMRSQAESVLRADPIAIVGMACRAPGGADTPDRLWELLCEGKDAISEVPPDRWDANAWYDPDLSAPAKSTTKWGGFLDRIDMFDADYFGILPREAERMDPQQRLLLEVAIEAIDDAGFPHERLRGSRAGVYIASYHNDYAQLQHSDVDAIDLRTLTGTLHSVLANRLSYFLDLRSPSMSIDTACSSSLVAIHLACQSLRFGETDLAIAGGVSLMITPELMVSMSKVGFMSPEGRCKTFDAGADGFVRGEGCGIVVLKRLSDAIANGDRIFAVIRGSAVNQDGRSTLLAAPNGPAQAALIRECLTAAQVSADRIGFFEAHGTGTALGDPIEVEAIIETIGRAVDASNQCLLGSIKANIGHLEAAAGVIGLIKAVLALRHEAIPPQPNFSKLNPHISLAGTRLSVPTALTPWRSGAVGRCAAVSSFGVGGTNANVILEEAPKVSPAAIDTQKDAPRVLTLSAQSPAALQALAHSWIEFLTLTDASVVELCHTASLRRTHYDDRLAVVGRSKEELRARLRDYLDQASSPAPAIAQSGATAPRVGFVFSGQGPQWYAMGRELLAEEAVFRGVIEKCDELLRPLSGWSLLEELARPEEDSRLDETEVAQPALFALQVALAALWKSWGVSPEAVIGHSVGEIAALHVAGVLDLPEAIRIVWHRGRIMQQATGLGRMAAVGLSETEARELVEPHGDRLSIGAVNAPQSVVLSGETSALETALATLTARGVNHRMLPVQYAFHSAQMTNFQHQLAEGLGAVRATPPAIAVYSTVAGGQMKDALFDAAYFGRNLRAPVRFADAATAMLKDGYDVIVEIGPQPVLASAIAECAAKLDRTPVLLASLRRGRAERETALQACAGLYGAGCNLVWERVQPSLGQIVDLPNYPWQRKRCWVRTRPVAHSSGESASGHPLLGRRIDVAGVEGLVFEATSRDAQAWLVDHRIGGKLLLPAAALLEAFAAAASALLDVEKIQLTAFSIQRPLAIPEPGEGEARWQIIAKRAEDGRAEIELYAAATATDGHLSGWQLIASAAAEPAPAFPDRAEFPAPGFESVRTESLYDEYKNRGAEFGPTFRCLNDIERGDNVARASVKIPELLEHTTINHALHPVLIDAGLQLCAVAAGSGSDRLLPEALFLPLGADRLVITRGLHRQLSTRAQVRDKSSATLVADVWFETPQGEPVLMIEGMRFARAEQGAHGKSDDDGVLYDVVWQRAPATHLSKVSDARGTWLLFADRGGTAEALASRIQAAGGHCCVISPGDAFERTSESSWIVNPVRPEHFVQVLTEGGWNNQNPLRGVVYCWSLDIPPAAASTGRSMELAAPAAVLHLVQALAKSIALAGGSLWLVTRGAQVVSGSESVGQLCPHAASVWGLANVIAMEQPNLAARVIDLDVRNERDDNAVALFTELLTSRSPRIALRGGGRWTPRLQHYRDPAAERVRHHDNTQRRATLARPGTFDGVELQSYRKSPPQPDEVSIRILSAGLNFRDVLLALNMYPGAKVPLGAECAGIITEIGSAVSEFKVGDKVVGFAPESLATDVNVPAAFLARVPEAINADDAAAMPVAFLTADFGLNHLAQLQRGQSILIHAAAGGVGLAAVQLAQRQGAEIHATAGSPEKREFLRSLGVAHVMDSRSLAFADQILEATAGKGVDVVLNSLSGDFIAASMRALARGGCFLELGKRGIWTPDDAAKSRPDIRYHAYDLGAEAHADRGLVRPMLDKILAAVVEGSLRRLPITVFPLAELRDAMRFMAQARHIGKIVLKAAADSGPIEAKSRCDADTTYWITGGLGALGCETSRWLVGRGARHLVLSGRRPPGPGAAACIRELEELGATVRVFQADAADRDQMQAVFDTIRNEMPPLRGVVHAAGAIRDAVLTNQHWDDAAEVLGGKVTGAWLLHELTAKLPLEFFILYSAAGVVLGAPGQGLYSAANAELDALAHFRRRLGLPALSVAWGSWAGAGMAADLAARGRDVWQSRGLGKIDPPLGFAQLDRLLADKATYAAVIPIDWTRFLSQLPPHAERDFFAPVAPAARVAQAVRPKRSGIVERLRALPPVQRQEALTAHLSECVLQALGLDAATSVNPRTPLKELGLDSLMAVELSNSLVRSGGQVLPATLLFDYPTLDTLATYLARVWGLEAGDAVSAETPTPSQSDSLIADLSEQDAEALLLKELELNDAERRA